MPRPANCAACGFSKMHEGDRCRRHSPGAISQSSLSTTTVWPHVRPDQRCGEGDAEGEIVPCVECIHWQLIHTAEVERPEGYWRALGEKPASADQVGQCVRCAMWPSAQTQSMGHSVTWATDGCGDGERQADDADGSL
jgi:hypothetical protein